MRVFLPRFDRSKCDNSAIYRLLENIEVFIPLESHGRPAFEEGSLVYEVIISLHIVVS